MADVEPGVKVRRKPRAERLPDTNDAIDIAMHAVASGKPLPDVARQLLEEQSRFVRAQTSEIRTRQVGERVRAALWTVLAVAAAAVLVLIGAMLVRASRTDALVVQSFRVPPGMAARGLTGEVVATQLLDRLAEMQEQSESTRAASSYANNWENDLKIDIPNTGATAEQVWKLLRGWLGKETRISGEVIESKDGLALTARVGSEPGKRFVDSDGDLDALITKGADLIYSQTQPYRHAIGLTPEREPERLANLNRLTAHESALERKWAYSGLSFTYRNRGDLKRAIAMAEKSLAIDPAMVPAMGNLSSAHMLLGHDQQTMDLHRRWQALKVGKEYDARIVAANGCNQMSSSGAILRDPAMLDQAVACFETSTSSMSVYAPWIRVTAALLRHDPAPALAYVSPAEGADSAEEALVDTWSTRLEGEMERGPGETLARALDEYRAARAKRNATTTTGYYRAVAPTQAWPFEARTLAKLGRLDEAARLIARTPLDCYDCVRTRGIVAEARGDRRAAQLHYLAAAKLGPRLPAAFADWGRLLAGAGRHQSAAVKLREAARLAPNWADPLKYQGDSLAAQGKRGEAAAKYDAALKLAPNWAALRAARAALP
jgi:tetratricopeptide (TPR) repeat protein